MLNQFQHLLIQVEQEIPGQDRNDTNETKQL